MNLPEQAKELSRIGQAVDTLTEKFTAFFTSKPNSEQLEAAQAEMKGVSAELEKVKTTLADTQQLKADLSTAQQTIGTLTTELVALNASLDAKAKEVADLNAKVDEAEGSSSKKAARIAAAQGVPAVPLKSDEGTAATNAPRNITEFSETMASITDPKQRAEFYAAHSAKFFKRR